MTDNNGLQGVAKNPTDGLTDNAAQDVDERNRLVRSVIQQPTDVLRDIAILAIGWAMHELEVMGRRHQGPVDFLSWAYGFRIIGLADGKYGHGMMMRATDDGPQMFDTSTYSLVSQLRKHAENGADQIDNEQPQGDVESTMLNISNLFIAKDESTGTYLVACPTVRLTRGEIDGPLPSISESDILARDFATRSAAWDYVVEKFPGTRRPSEPLSNEEQKCGLFVSLGAKTLWALSADTLQSHKGRRPKQRAN